ncbi:MAG: hypothetical protein J0L92_10765 [Deltaproteobacteria bacterium]|nr:hypothetical protein [Deltaproteobacteria bacterium]
MRHTSVLLAFALLSPFTLAASASAQGRESEVEVMDFLDGDQVTGDLVGPWHEILSSRRLGMRRTLIRARAEFQQEMLKSVENL